MNKQTIGLAYRANKVCFGIDMTIDKIKAKKVYLVLLANDASQGTQKKIAEKTEYYQIPLDNSLSTTELSVAIGKQNIKVIGILDKGLAISIKK